MSNPELEINNDSSEKTITSLLTGHKGGRPRKAKNKLIYDRHWLASRATDEKYYRYVIKMIDKFEDLQYRWYRPYYYQKRFLEDKSQFRLVVKSRQIGFTYTIAYEAIISCLKKKNHTVIIVCPSEAQAHNIIRYVQFFVKGMPFVKDAFKAKVEFTNGSRIIALPNNPYTVRGYSGDVYLDEFAYFYGNTDKDILAAIMPMISRGYRLTVISTPYGMRGEFYKMFQNTQNIWSIHRIPFYHAVVVKNPIYDRPQLDPATIENIRQERGDSIFRQEYLCSFSSEDTTVFSYDLLLSTAEPYSYVNVPNEDFYRGIDFGKTDLTAIVDLVETEKEGVYKVAAVRTIGKVDYSEQLEAIARTSSKAIRIAVDATSMGGPLSERLKKDYGLNVIPITFTAQMKDKLISELKIALVNKQIILNANDTDLINDLHSIERTITPSGRISYVAQRVSIGKGKKSHADRAWALALAWYAAHFKDPPIKQPKVLFGEYTIV